MAITQIQLTAGDTTGVHVTVEDQDGTALPVNNLSWGAITGVTITPDGPGGMGFTFTADSTAAASAGVQATYSGPRAAAAVAGPILTVDVVPAPVEVTALQYVSP